MTEQWSDTGKARASLMVDEDAGLSAMLTGMDSLSYGEQAGARMRPGLILNDLEDEHDCFSDNTHNSHYYDGKGVQNVCLGQYTRVDGSVVSGPSIADLVAVTNVDLDTEMHAKLDATMKALGHIKVAAESGFAYDQMLERGNAEGGTLIMGGVNGLIDQTRSIGCVRVEHPESRAHFVCYNPDHKLHHAGTVRILISRGSNRSRPLERRRVFATFGQHQF